MKRAARVVFAASSLVACLAPQEPTAIGTPADGYRGIWYANQKSDDEYAYKYSGGLGTYCAKHNPFAVYCAAVDKTFFCYGGTTADSLTRLHHMVASYDHATGTVPRPTTLLDKRTGDAHDNPVIAVDDEGHVWIFSTSHGRGRPSFVHRSCAPYDISAFERVDATYEAEDGSRQPLDNFSYMQAWHVPGRGFACFFTRYRDPAARTSMFMHSEDGVRWSRWQRLAAIEEGHYQISAARSDKLATACNYHPAGKGLNWRTNLYYLESTDFGASWRTASGERVDVPLTAVANAALVRDYAAEGLLVYLKDIDFDAEGRPVLLYLTSRGFEAGPANAPRTWTTARWTGERWEVREITQSDNNYDMGSLYLEDDPTWRVIAPTADGPQRFNPGGEIVAWRGEERGARWTVERALTSASPRNHGYVRRPVRAHSGFTALWADGHGREPSVSRLWFADRDGRVFLLPPKIEGASARPIEYGERAQPDGFRLVYAQDFDAADSVAEFAFSDPAAWRHDADGRLALHAASAYRPPYPSPRGIAVLRTPRVGSFVLEVELEQTGRDYGHRDLCVLFGIESPERYYYAHLASVGDATAHHVHLVDRAARRPVTTVRTEGVDWGRGVRHRVRVERDAARGAISVWFDDLRVPVLVAEDRTLQDGYVGFGSFDDTGCFDRVRLWAAEARDERAGFFER